MNQEKTCKQQGNSAAPSQENHKTMPITQSDSARYLEVLFGPDKGRLLKVGIGRFVIGRAPDCNLVLKDPTVSRRHCAITISVQGIQVEDLASVNGIQVQGETSATAQIRPGDIFQLGRTAVRVVPESEMGKVLQENIHQAVTQEIPSELLQESKAQARSDRPHLAQTSGPAQTVPSFEPDPVVKTAKQRIKLRKRPGKKAGNTRDSLSKTVVSWGTIAAVCILVVLFGAYMVDNLPSGDIRIKALTNQQQKENEQKHSSQTKGIVGFGGSEKTVDSDKATLSPLVATTHLENQFKRAQHLYQRGKLEDALKLLKELSRQPTNTLMLGSKTPSQYIEEIETTLSYRKILDEITRVITQNEASSDELKKMREQLEQIPPTHGEEGSRAAFLKDTIDARLRAYALGLKARKLGESDAQQPKSVQKNGEENHNTTEKKKGTQVVHLNDFPQFAKAKKAYAARRFEQCLRELTKIKNSPSKVELKRRLAQLIKQIPELQKAIDSASEFERKHNFTKAIESLKQARKLDSKLLGLLHKELSHKLAQLHLKYAEVLIGQNRVVQASKELKNAEELGVPDKDVTGLRHLLEYKAASLLNQAKQLAAQNPEKTAEIVEKVLIITPKNSPLRREAVELQKKIQTN